MLSRNAFTDAIERDGWILFPDVLTTEETACMRKDCLEWIDACERIQVAQRINESGDGTAHHTIGKGDSIDAFVASHRFHEFLYKFFYDRPYILHACNPVGGAPKANTYVHRIHRDTATYIENFNFRINMLVMLDDFKRENGATLVLPGSHKRELKPLDNEFEQNCLPILGEKGSVVLFNSYLWHRGGHNETSLHRVALTLSYGPAFIKPQLDYARMLGDNYGGSISELTRQVLGYNSRVAISREEWYQPRANRLYHSNQG